MSRSDRTNPLKTISEEVYTQTLAERMAAAAAAHATLKQPKVGKYEREIRPGVWVDVYDVLKAWGVSNPALQHLIKKALQPGERGHKTLEQDMDDIIASARRARELVA